MIFGPKDHILEVSTIKRHTIRTQTPAFKPMKIMY